ncbi:chemotaxis protein CheB [Hymenobacter sp. GOD-10R]|uniref:chemotaxis protein CheB n=1 Tax=Hymenobacter sp. GOD-10R TaxID=3093922 RepID=UPI002D76CB23|nr:chemotaxis protein CheB [Hymenobacter sp. GOD-10R]WRQ29272.1 chemotaxis protein CheB [Hymenobacter sp. GOD-10R]
MAQRSSTPSAKPCRDIVVIGSSAGGVTALLDLAAALPPDFPAPIFVVHHVGAGSASVLPQLMNRVSALTVKHADDGEKMQPGFIYIARPDHHLLIENDQVLITKGPKENRFRPSIDALFRSAAYSYGPRVIGIILTGYLDDGTSGLWAIKRLGGLTVVQEPKDAEFPDMPLNALQFVAADYVVPVVELASLLTRLTLEPVSAKKRADKAELELLQLELAIAKQGNAFELGIIERGVLTSFTCPDCHGALTQLIEGDLIRFRCHTGHAYTVSALLGEVTESVESMLYQSMRGLEETKMLLQRLGEHFGRVKQPAVADLFLRKAEQTAKQARIVHDSILEHQSLSGDLQFDIKTEIP